MNTRNRRQLGFSLVELLVVLFILTLVMGVIFQQINSVQQRSRTEQTRLDDFSEAREFMDEFVRDVHQAGYPDGRMFSTTPAPTSSTFASGIVYASPSWITIEGDVDGDGDVDSVQYQLSPINGTCPCLLQRSQVPKVAGNPLPVALGGSQPSNFSIEVQNLVNSSGINGGVTTVPIAGTTALFTGPGQKGAEATTMIQDDTYYANLKTEPVFTYYLKYNVAGVANAGQPVPVGFLPVSVGNDPNGIIPKIGAVRIQMNVVSRTPDPQTGAKPYITLTSTGRINNIQ